MTEGPVLPTEKSVGRTVFLVLARVANAAYFLVTATYCVLTYSSFAYQQFIRPHLVASLATFVVWHHVWHWVALGITAITIVPEVRAGRGRSLAWTYLVIMAGVGVLVLARPILPSVENDALGLRLAFLFLLPPLWLSLYDHVVTSDRFSAAPAEERRILRAALVSALVIWAMHLLAVPLRFGDLGDLPMSGTALVFGAATSLLLHTATFASLALVLLAAMRAGALIGKPGIAQYWITAALSCGATWLIVGRLVFARLSFFGAEAWLLAGALALTLTGVWSGAARRLSAGRHIGASALDIWFSLIPAHGSRSRAWVVLALLPGVSYLAVERVAAFDWDFLVQNLTVVAVWLSASGCVYLAHRGIIGRVRAVPMLLAAGVLFSTGAARGPIESGLSSGLARPPFVPEFALDAYAASDPSYRLIRHLLSVEPSDSAAFFGQLRRNSLIQHVAVDPIDVDFVAPLGPAPLKPPHVFLLIVDSLRRDYVSAYNPAVTFTPSLARFAAESDTFTRAFSRYGGTGLSVPALWTGGMLLHKEYVLPFQPMNTLDKLLEANRYRKLLSLDHITAQIVETKGSTELDRGRDEMQYDLCATLGELQSTLAQGPGRAPIFAHTRSLNLHVSKLTNRSLSLDRAYEGFQGPAAAAIGRMDRCFGEFIDFLKRSDLYDDSIVILTSDHGDSLGEAKRWGHSYTIFPEILRIPLIIHVPPRLRRDLVADHDAASFSTDITPTIYALLGYAPRDLGWAYGASLFVPSGTDQSWRRREAVLVASSYGPVYGLVEQNGSALYIADGVNGRDYAYDLSHLRPERVGVTPERRQTSRARISAQVTELAEMYGFNPGP
jgi:hypothetical protein